MSGKPGKPGIASSLVMPRLPLRSLLLPLLIAGRFMIQTRASDPQPMKLPFNPANEHLSTDVDGPWPTIPITYGDAVARLDCYLTLSHQSIFLAPQTWAEDAANAADVAQVLCPENFTFPRFFQQDATNLTDAQDFPANFTYLTDYTWNPSFIFNLLHLDGSGYQSSQRVLSSNGMKHQLSILAGTNVTVTPTNISATWPLLMSQISLSGDESHANLIPSLYNASIIPSKAVGLHMGSVDVSVPGSLYLGGFDTCRILGELYVFTLNETDSLTLIGVSIGVEEGFLPLKGLVLPNGSFPQGPYTYDSAALRLGSSTYYDGLENVVIEPGAPYLYLPHRICDALAETLDLVYDPALNLYMWRNNASEPLFHCPAYLQFDLSIPPARQAKQLKVKIPFALLQNTFHGNIMFQGGQVSEPSRYFPCSPIDLASGIGWYRPIALGRAFLQAAFLGASFEGYNGLYGDGTWLLGQAPGPRNLTTENIVTIHTGASIPAVVNENLPFAWTESWLDVLPVWTHDADGTSLEQRNARSRMSDREKTAIGIATPVGTIALAVLGIFALKSVRKSRSEWKQTLAEMAQEDEVARRIEAEELEKQRIARHTQPACTNSPLEENVDAISMIPNSHEEAFEDQVLLAPETGTSSSITSQELSISMQRIARKPVKSPR